MGCIVLDTLYQLDLSLLEVLFVYTINMSLKEHFSILVHILSLQFVTGLLDSSKGWAKGHVLVSGPWSGSIECPGRFLKPIHSLKIPSIECFHNSYRTYLLPSLHCDVH